MNKDMSIIEINTRVFMEAMKKAGVSEEQRKEVARICSEFFYKAASAKEELEKSHISHGKEC